MILWTEALDKIEELQELIEDDLPEEVFLKDAEWLENTQEFLASMYETIEKQQRLTSKQSAAILRIEEQLQRRCDASGF